MGWYDRGWVMRQRLERDVYIRQDIENVICAVWAAGHSGDANYNAGFLAALQAVSIGLGLTPQAERAAMLRFVTGSDVAMLGGG